jgi:hypothetical protein
VPYDFDYSGVVNAEYAHPPDFARIRSVRERLYRGFCRPEIDWDEVFRRFLDQRNEVMDAIETLPGLVDSRRDFVRKYINRFWDILETKQKRDRLIVKACRKMPPPIVISSGSEGV